VKRMKIPTTVMTSLLAVLGISDARGGEQQTVKAMSAWVGQEQMVPTGSNSLYFVGCFRGVIFVENAEGDLHAGRMLCPGTMIRRGRLMRVGVVLASVMGTASVAHAAPPYDGSVPLRCAIETVMVCRDPSVCVRGTAQTVLLPAVITVDVGQFVISGAATGLTARITATGQGPGKLMIAGQDVETLGKMWGLVVEETTGAMSGAVLSHGGGFLMFGTCAGQ